EDGAALWNALRAPQAEFTPMPFHNFLTNPKTKARPTEALGREERLECPCGGLRRHSGSVVGDSEKSSLSAGSIVSFSAPKQKSAAASMHRIDRISDHIAQYLANL